MKAIRRPSRVPAALVVSGSGMQRTSLGRWLAGRGFRPHAVGSAEKARRELAESRFELVLGEADLLDDAGPGPGGTGPPASPVFGACAPPLPDAAPADPPRLVRLGRMIGSSTAMQRVYEQVLRVAPTDATVFLTGETGTGKELAAEAIHGLGARSRGPFAPINCGAIPPELVESELFGHEKGSFTGAVRRRAGLFERARGGTVFLDEITEMSLGLQVKLLRMLESGGFHRVGGEERVDLDVRVIAATNRDPREAARGGSLRRDLLYRLLVFPIELPPLRRRAEDVPAIASHCLERLNDDDGGAKALAPDVVERLTRHGWPGNVRELRNALERAFILADRTIDTSCFALGAGRCVREGDAGLRVPVGTSLAEVERRLILATLEWLQGDKKATSQALGISVKTLYTRLSAYAAARRARESAVA